MKSNILTIKVDMNKLPMMANDLDKSVPTTLTDIVRDLLEHIEDGQLKDDLSHPSKGTVIVYTVAEEDELQRVSK